MSAMLSPLAKDVDFGSATPDDLPPRRCIADSKESRGAGARLEEDGCITLPAHNPLLFRHFFRTFRPKGRNIDSISLLVRSSMVN